MLDVAMLGQFDVRLDGEPVDLTSRPLQLLLAYLMLNVGQTLPREKIAGVLWPESLESTARKNLRNYVWRLRKAIGDDYLSADRNSVTFDAMASYRLDVQRLEEGTDADSTAALIEAVSAYRGELLPGHYDDWVQRERERVRAIFERRMQTLLNRLTAEARWSELVTWAEHWIAFGQTPEPAYRSLMIGHAGLGDLAGVAKAYHRCEKALKEELNVELSAETESLFERLSAGERPVVKGIIRRDDQTVMTRDLVAGGPAMNERQFPPRHNLPAQASPFVGREKELAGVNGRLEAGCRLVTLLGPGGSGKTRLAIELARRRAASYRNGAALVELAPLSDHTVIPTAIATALDFRFTAGGSPSEEVLNYLANKEMLLVLDNFEHLLDGVELVGDLLQAAPSVRIIATSRVRLNLGSELLFEVDGLGLPEDGRYEYEDGFEASEAVTLFLEHTHRVQPSFAVDAVDKAAIARICRLVEGMPLALELAASWVRYMPPAEIARELADDLDFLESTRADLPERQRSMRAAFDHSWDLLDEDGRDALIQLAVFRGGASRQAAIAVTGANLHTLVALADHSLLRRDPDSGRFAIHELICQFALERLEEKAAYHEVRDAHSNYYLRVLAGRLSELQGGDQLGALDAIEKDFENVRAAWNWALRHGEWKHMPKASESLFLFALFRNRYKDGVELFEAARRALSSPTTAHERLARAYSLASWQVLLVYLGLQEDALAAVPELQAVVATLDDSAAAAYCQMMLGRILTQPGPVFWDGSEAMIALDAARAYYQQAHDPFYRAMVLWRLGAAQGEAGEHEAALELGRRGLASAREAGDRFIAAAILHNLGVGTWRLEGPNETSEAYYKEAADLNWEIGAKANYALSLSHVANGPLWREADLAKSRPLLEEALAVAVEQNDPSVRLHTLLALSAHQLLDGKYERVLALTQEALALVEKDTPDWGIATFFRGAAFLALGELDEALPLMAQALSCLLPFVKHAGLRDMQAYLGVLLARLGEHRRAVELLALGFSGYQHRALASDQLVSRTRAELKEILDDEDFAAAWERGKELDPLAVAEEVLQALETDGRNR